jgi:tripartite-type tricarboxylate transporter receptor subunit TctC
MDPQVVDRINDAVRQALQTPEVRQKLVATGNTVRIETPAEFAATVKKDRARWAELVRSIGVTVE